MPGADQRKDKATKKIRNILMERFYIHPDVAQELSELIFKEVITPAIEEEYEEWVQLSKLNPSGWGYDA